MKEALNPKNELIDSLNADYGIYFCPECTCIVYLRIMEDKIPHFYHFRKNTSCSLSSDSNSDEKWLSQASTDKVNELKNGTKENWYEAIDWLLRNGQINRLVSHEWASVKICMYIGNKFDSLSKQYLIDLLILLIHYHDISSLKNVINYSGNLFITDNDRIGICKELQSMKIKVTEELYELILDNIPLENQLMLYALMESDIKKKYMKTLEPYVERLLPVFNTNIDFSKRMAVIDHLQHKFKTFHNNEEKRKSDELLLFVLTGLIDTDSKKILRNFNTNK